MRVEVVDEPGGLARGLLAEQDRPAVVREGGDQPGGALLGLWLDADEGVPLLLSLYDADYLGVGIEKVAG